MSFVVIGFLVIIIILIIEFMLAKEGLPVHEIDHGLLCMFKLICAVKFFFLSARTMIAVSHCHFEFLLDFNSYNPSMLD